MGFTKCSLPLIQAYKYDVLSEDQTHYSLLRIGLVNHYHRMYTDFRGPGNTERVGWGNREKERVLLEGESKLM